MKAAPRTKVLRNMKIIIEITVPSNHCPVVNDNTGIDQLTSRKSYKEGAFFGYISPKNCQCP